MALNPVTLKSHKPCFLPGNLHVPEELGKEAGEEVTFMAEFQVSPGGYILECHV